MADLDYTGNAPKTAAQPGPRQPPTLPPTPGWRWRFVSIAAILWMALIAATVYVKYKGGVGSALAPFLPAPDLAQVFGKPNLRVLVMGLDENWTDSDVAYTAGARTDTLIGVNIDLATKQISVLSIPRDLWVYIPKSGYGKINEAYGDGGPAADGNNGSRTLGVPPSIIMWSCGLTRPKTLSMRLVVWT